MIFKLVITDPLSQKNVHTQYGNLFGMKLLNNNFRNEFTVDK